MATVYFENRQDFYTPNPALIHSICDHVLAEFGKSSVEVGVFFISGEEMCDLHEEHMEDPTLTDCITFPIETDDPNGYLGDVFIAPVAAKVYLEDLAPNPGSKKFPLTPEALGAEITRYLVHTLLHLCGLQDQTREQSKEMRESEDKFLTQLSAKNLLLK